MAVRVTVIQDGARLHYAVPLAIQRAGCLERMYTTWYSAPGSGARMAARVLAACGFAPAVSMLHRYTPELRRDSVWSAGWINVFQRLFHGRFKTDVERYLWEAGQLAKRVRRLGFGNANTLFGFLGSIHPELLALAKQRGLTTVGDQYIAPVAVQRAEDALQRARFPGWSRAARDEVDKRAEAWERESWEHTDYITCASEYVRRGLIAEGISPQRVNVLPYPIDVGQFQYVERAGRKGPMRVGFVGTVGLRKGAGYFLEVAKRFPRERVEFSMIGPIQLSPEAVGELKGRVELVGAVPRPEVLRRLRALDVFFLPSTCEGSAGATMEAMATGLPVVTSPNSGSIVRSGEDGFIHAYADIDGYCAAIEIFAKDENRRLALGQAARKAAERCSIEAYSVQWSTLLRGSLEQRAGSAAK